MEYYIHEAVVGMSGEEVFVRIPSAEEGMLDFTSSSEIPLAVLSAMDKWFCYSIPYYSLGTIFSWGRQFRFIEALAMLLRLSKMTDKEILACQKKHGYSWNNSFVLSREFIEKQGDVYAN